MWATLRGCVGGLLGEPLRWVLGEDEAARRADPVPDDRAERRGHPGPPGAPGALLGPAGPLPPGPWRWRWQWPAEARPAGMALVAADGTLLLWSPGGFAAPGGPADGRPTPDVATALARLPALIESADDADTLREELDRARAVAAQTRRLLDRAVGIVDDEIGRVHRPAG